MKYVSIDLETTGLNPEIHQILQIGAVVEDTTAALVPVDSLPAFSVRIQYDQLVGEPVALSMNCDLITSMGSALPLNDAIEQFENFLVSNCGEKWIAAGKNFATFDLRFLSKIMDTSNFRHRVIDAASVALGSSPILWGKETPPSLGELIGKSVKHDALEDAKDVVRVLRKYTNHYGREA